MNPQNVILVPTNLNDEIEGNHSGFYMNGENNNEKRQKFNRIEIREDDKTIYETKRGSEYDEIVEMSNEDRDMSNYQPNNAQNSPVNKQIVKYPSSDNNIAINTKFSAGEKSPIVAYDSKITPKSIVDKYVGGNLIRNYRTDNSPDVEGGKRQGLEK